MVSSSPLIEHTRLAVTLGEYGNNVPSSMTISHGNTKNAASISFQRTLRVPDNQVINNLPPSLGQFPLFSVADYKDRMPQEMANKGGVFLPMYQREAMWLRFSAAEPFALKIYVGGVNAISGVPIKESPEAALKRLALSEKVKQDYVVLPEQPWLDGIASDDGRIRQFVAMPKGSGYSVEAQVTGEEKIDGMQFELTPVKRGCPASLMVEFSKSNQYGQLHSENKILDLQAKRLSDISTMLDLKKAIEAEFDIAVADQELSLRIPEHTYRSPNFTDDQLAFLELWFPESAVLQVRKKTPIIPIIPVRAQSMRRPALASSGFSGATANFAHAESGAAPPVMDSMLCNDSAPTGFPAYSSFAPMSSAAQPSPAPPVFAKAKSSVEIKRKRSAVPAPASSRASKRAPPINVQAMSLAAGGLIKQSINADPYPASIWDSKSSIMFNVQLLNSESFMAVTGRVPPTSPISAETYQQHGYPFFDIWNEELSGVKGDFGVVKSVGEMDESKAKQEKKDFWGKMSGEEGEDTKVEEFKRDEPLKFPVIMLDKSLARTFKPIKEMEEEANKLRATS